MPAPAEPPPSGPACGACGGTAVVNWRRRLTADELADHVAQEQARRDEALLLADPANPPAFPPLPDGSDDTRTVYSCGAHAIGMEAAGLIHQSACTAPNEKHLPDCNCTPEARPQGQPEPAIELPAHWQGGGE
ncbi:hypothetical protein AB0N99_30885 [Streptomyces sp. NPDC093272]|uniref:hypothetical protein n=1 Tax=Streptomyces sp. NPDC093272 TaxID=3154981 RepID=UPI0034122B87